MKWLTEKRVWEGVLFFLLVLVALGMTGYTVGLNLPAVGLTGQESRVRVLECETKGGGRGGTYTECVAEPVEGSGTGPRSGTVEVRYEGEVGDVIAARTTPWGSHVAVRTDFLGRAVALAAPFLPLMGVAASAYGLFRVLRPDPD